MVLEVLLNEIQKDDQIQGIKIKNYQFKYRAFADDMVFFLEDSEENIIKLFKKINEYGQLAGFKINKNKSKFLLKNVKKEEANRIQNGK